ncbi:MAG: glycosyl hydrolase [Microscillaceae bacterium]|nr:glycosyl hydrolase [Microscillaceae bacterium]MDW8459783.1 glycosyl hydrolase [Cytophagales bacterium]
MKNACSFFALSSLLALFCANQLPSFAQKRTYDTTFYNNLQYRLIGPFRGGRSAAVTGVANKPMLYYFGSTGGGVWKTTDAGATWTNISDGFFGGSIGAIAVSEYDNNVIYVGGGEKTWRGNVSHGYGMWKSVNAGKTWQNIGLNDSRHISRIRIHPKNPDLVYVAVMGHAFGQNTERGVYRTKDGGNTWERILFVNSQTAAVDLAMDPSNPRILYATMWRAIRTPYSFESGGEGSSIWKSTDGGDTWVEITRKPGLPKGTIGIAGIAVSPVQPDRVWAIIEAEDGGVFRSDNGGENWQKLNDERKLRQRAWYYTRIYADTQNPDVVYVVNVEFHKSKDGGKTFQAIPTPHGDHHDLWIAPENPERMIIADDGGAQVSLDGGNTWSTYMNQPTAQIYRISTDNHFPYRIYGSQQDNTAFRILSRTDEGAITNRHWQETAGGESGYIVPDPRNPDIVYGGSYGGYLTRLDHQSNEERQIDVYPDNPMGWGAEHLKYRFQWNFPIMFSPNSPNTLYAAANVLFKSTNEGQTWKAISPDLTRNDKTKMKASGGPITKDNTGVEYYGTIFALAESAQEKNLIWVGSDDGLVHLTKDGGKTWENVTPKKDCPEWIMWNSIDVNPFVKGGAYLAGTRYKLDDFQPYLYKTTDYGKTWKKITAGIPNRHFTRVLRADPVRQGLLYAGTESGIYVSFDDGESWQTLQLNLPIVPITDIQIKGTDLIVATQGRSIWILDDLHILRQLNEISTNAEFYLFKPKNVYNKQGYQAHNPKLEGKNPVSGVPVHFFLSQKPDTTQVITLEFLTLADELIRKFSTKVEKSDNPLKPTTVGKLDVKKGANLFVWDMRTEDALGFEGLILWASELKGPKVVPDKYKVKLTVGNQSQTAEFEIKKDPRIESSISDLQAQYDFLISIRNKLTQTHQAILQIRQLRQDLQNLQKRFATLPEAKPVLDQAKAIEQKITEIENNLYQTKNRSSQDPLNFPIKLNNKLSALGSAASVGFYKPTDQMYTVRDSLMREIDKELFKLNQIVKEEVPLLNDLVQKQPQPAIQVLKVDFEVPKTEGNQSIPPSLKEKETENSFSKEEKTFNLKQANPKITENSKIIENNKKATEKPKKQKKQVENKPKTEKQPEKNKEKSKKESKSKE